MGTNIERNFHPPQTQERKFLKGIILLFFGTHFALAILGALEIKIFSQGPFSLMEEIYGDLTGASSGFKFFAPNVGTDPRVIFEVSPRDQGHGRSEKRPTKEIHHFITDQESNSEVELRLKSLVNQFWVDSEDGQLRRSLTASWSAKMFARYPQAQSLVVKVQSYYLPTMEEWSEGIRPQWEDFYTVKYHRGVH